MLLHFQAFEQVLNHYNLFKLSSQSISSLTGIPSSQLCWAGIQGRLFSHRLIERSRSDILSTINVKKWLDDVGNAVVTLDFRLIQIPDLHITVALTLSGLLEMFLKFILTRMVSTLYTFYFILFYLTSDHL